MEKIVRHLKKPLRVVRKIPSGREYLFEPFDRKNERHLYLTALVVLFVAAVNIVAFGIKISAEEVQAASTATINPSTIVKQQSKFVSNEILVKVKQGVNLKEDSNNTGIASINQINKDLGVTKFEKAVKAGRNSQANAELFRWYKVTLPGEATVITGDAKRIVDEAKLQKYKPTILDYSRAVNDYKNNHDMTRVSKILNGFATDPNVEDIDVNLVVQTTQSATPPNDPYYASKGSWGQSYDDLWGMKKINAAGAWAKNTGSSQIIVAGIDTGVDRNHEDLAANMWVNSKEVPNNGVDDDGDGYVDDYYGWDFANNDNDPMDDHGHGTHTAGTIGAVGNNGLGVTGVNWNVKIMALKFLSSYGYGYSEDGAKAIMYAADHGARVINASWGGAGTNGMIHDAIEYAHSKNVLFIAAAGNNNGDASFFSPANELNAITVAATDSNDARATFSNWGTKIDVAAPGVDVLSLRAAGTDMYGNGQKFVPPNDPSAKYYRANGTSMAAPHVSGLVALILANHPSFSADEVRWVLKVSADETNASGFDIYTGAGRINAAKALAVTSVLHVAITSPDAGYDFTEKSTVVIKGTVQGTNLVSWDLAYGQGASPTSWQSINSSNVPVVNDLLGTMNTSNFNEHTYTVRLLAKDSQGLEFDSYIAVNQDQYVSRLAVGQANQWMPDISANYIVWFDQGDYTIRLYDLLTKTDRKIWTLPTGWDLGYSHISGNRIVWAAGLSPGYDLYLYDIATNTIKNLTNKPDIRFGTRMYGDKIVYEKYLRYPAVPTSNYDIYMFDITSGKETALTNDPSDQRAPDIYQNKVVWTDDRYGVILYDLVTGTQRQLSPTNGLFGEDTPSIWGQKVVWGSTSDRRVHIYDLSTNTETVIPGNYLDGIRTRISEDKIVWQSSTCFYCPTNIFSYDITSKTVFQITYSNNATHTNPKVSGGRIVWEDTRNTPDGQVLSNWDIYLYDPPNAVPLPSPTPTPLPSPSVAPSPQPSVSPISPDSDKDGFSDALEAYMGTDSNSACGANAWPPDIDNDKTVTILDLSMVSRAYGAKVGESKYNKRYDMNANGSIDTLDLNIISQYYQKRCS